MMASMHCHAWELFAAVHLVPAGAHCQTPLSNSEHDFIKTEWVCESTVDITTVDEDLYGIARCFQIGA